MKIVLRSDVFGLGRKGDVADVADGYARNYLLPKGLALRASAGVEAQAEAMRRARMLRNASDKAEAQQLAELLRSTTIRVTAKAGREGKLFGSVGATDIAMAISAQTGARLERKQIDLDDPIKAVGSYTVGAHLYADVDASVTVEVVAK